MSATTSSGAAKIKTDNNIRDKQADVTFAVLVLVTEVCCMVGCDALKPGASVPKFRSNLLSSLSRLLYEF
jgi:methylphosphotriester-DNA--protein-cysteine methyltransferase